MHFSAPFAFRRTPLKKHRFLEKISIKKAFKEML